MPPKRHSMEVSSGFDLDKMGVAMKDYDRKEESMQGNESSIAPQNSNSESQIKKALPKLYEHV